MEFLLLGLVAGIGFASYALWSQLRATPGEEPPRLREKSPTDDAVKGALPAPVDRTPMTLQVGDIVQHLGTDYLVEGALTFSEGARGTRLYRLMDGAAERYLYAAPPPEEPLLLERAAGEGPIGEPDSFTHSDVIYRLTARALAAAIGVGALGASASRARPAPDNQVAAARSSFDQIRILLYSGAAGARLLALDWGSHVELYVGTRVLPHALEILPGR
jgi:hypothetical protein